MKNTNNPEMDFLRLIITAESPRNKAIELIRAKQMPENMVVTYKDYLPVLIKVFHLETVALKIEALGKLQAEGLPEEIYATVAGILIEKPKAPRQELGLQEALAASREQLTQESNRRRRVRDRERLLEQTQQLSAKQMIQLMRQSPMLFAPGDEIIMESSGTETSVTTIIALQGWEQEIVSGDRELAVFVKKEIAGVIEEFIEEFSKDQCETLWRAVKSIARQISKSARWIRGNLVETEQLDVDDELLEKFAEVRSRLSQNNQQYLASISEEEAMLQLVAWLRVIADDSDLQFQLGLKGNVVLRDEWLQLVEEEFLGRLYKRKLAEARARVEDAAMSQWQKIQILGSEILTPELEGQLLDGLRLVKKIHDVYASLPEQVWEEVYGKRTVVELTPEPEKTSVPYVPSKYPTLAVAYNATVEAEAIASVTKASPRWLRDKLDARDFQPVQHRRPVKTSKPAANSEPKKKQTGGQKPKGEKKYAPSGEAQRIVVSEADYRQALSLVPRNKGTSHKKRRVSRQVQATI